MDTWKHVRAVVLLPLMVTVVIPAAILYLAGANACALSLAWPFSAVLVALGAAFLGLGLALAATTIRLFAVIGRGTLAPWSPTRKLVVRGPYRYVRNPMITGVACVLMGECMLTASPALAGWLALFVAANAVYIPLSEEPGLAGRFGDDYAVYRRHVPRWIPRRTPWNPPPDAPPDERPGP